jgi:hypothetical protein
VQATSQHSNAKPTAKKEQTTNQQTNKPGIGDDREPEAMKHAPVLCGAPHGRSDIRTVSYAFARLLCRVMQSSAGRPLFFSSGPQTGYANGEESLFRGFIHFKSGTEIIHRVIDSHYFA